MKGHTFSDEEIKVLQSLKFPEKHYIQQLLFAKCTCCRRLLPRSFFSRRMHHNKVIDAAGEEKYYHTICKRGLAYYCRDCRADKWQRQLEIRRAAGERIRARTPTRGQKGKPNTKRKHRKKVENDLHSNRSNTSSNN